MAENLKGVLERSMRRVFRVYLEPANYDDTCLNQEGSTRQNHPRSSRKRKSYKEVDILKLILPSF